MFFCSTIAGLIPVLWGVDFVSFLPLIMSAIGALIGIYLGYRISQYIGTPL
jgi:hypothetical protein